MNDQEKDAALMIGSLLVMRHVPVQGKTGTRQAIRERVDETWLIHASETFGIKLEEARVAVLLYRKCKYDDRYSLSMSEKEVLWFLALKILSGETKRTDAAIRGRALKACEAAHEWLQDNAMRLRVRKLRKEK